MAQHGNLIDLDLEGQVAALRKELGALRRGAAKRGSSYYEDASDTVSDFLSDMSERFVPSMSGIRSQAKAVERVAYNHPAVVATVGLVVIGLVASLLLSGRSTSEPSREGSSGASRKRGRSRSR